MKKNGPLSLENKPRFSGAIKHLEWELEFYRNRIASTNSAKKIKRYRDKIIEIKSRINELMKESHG